LHDSGPNFAFALSRNHQKNLRREDVATTADTHHANGGEVGYSIGVFNAVGDTIAVTSVAESALRNMAET